MEISDENQQTDSNIITDNNEQINKESKINPDNSNENIIQKILNENNEDILKKLFKISKTDTNKFLPMLRKDGSETIKSLFIDSPKINDSKTLKDIIIKRIDLINKIKEIIGNSYEILYIIFDYLSQHNTSIFIYFIELYINCISLCENESKDKNIIIENIKNIFSWFISCGLLNKKTIDYLFQKIALFQLEKKLTKNIFNDILPLLEIIYGKYYNDSLKNSFIGKKYIYLYDKDTSLISTNISQYNAISIKNGFCIILWFYLNNYEESPKSNLCEIKTNNSQQINFILSDNYDIEVEIEYNNNSLILKEQESKTFNIKQKEWTQLKIEFTSTEISLYLCQKNINDNNTESESETKLFEKKTYIMTKNNELDSKNEDGNNINVIENFNFENASIIDMMFFRNYIGIIGTILFFKKLTNEVKNMEPIDSLYGLENKKVNEFIRDKKLFSIYFIFAPSLYLYDQNQIIDSANNCIAELPIRPSQEGKDVLNLNSIFNYHNYINNIFYLGGCYNFLPLFEIFYKFSLEESDINYLKNMFNNLFKLIEVVLVKREKNSLLPIKKETSFFGSLQLFMEKIDKKYYYDNEILLKILLNISSNYYNILIIKKMIKLKENSGFLTNILFNPYIIMKFNLCLQQLLFKEINDYSIEIPFENINILLLLLSKEYKNDEIEKNKYSKTLFDYISKIFDNINVDDSQRESMFLLYKNKNNIYINDVSLSDNIFIHIMNVFILYLEFWVNNKDNNEGGRKRRRNTINYFLNSNNYFIENLLNYLSTTNIHVKKVIINFLRVLTQNYGDILDQYFLKGSKNKKNKNRINKDEFYDFIKENIAPNYSNENIKEDDIIDDNKKKEKNTCIFYLENEEESNENKINDNQKKENINKKRNKSSEKKDEIIKYINNILGEKQESKNRKNRKKSFSKKYKINILDKDTKLINIKASKEKDNKINEKNNFINDSNIKIQKLNSKEKKLTEEEKIVIQNTKNEISLVLYNWLVSLILEKETSNDKKIEESINHVIDYLVKLISFSKEIKVIYRTLLLIWDQKDRSKLGINIYNNNNIYSKLLNHLSKNKLFIQILIELLINSYIYKHLEKNKNYDLFIIINKSKADISKIKEKYINLIYSHSKELLIDIYFDERNINKNYIIVEMYNIILKISRGFEDNIDEYKRSLLFQFLKEFFLDICNNYNKMKYFNLSDYIIFFTLFIEYTFLLKTADDYMKNIYEKIKTDCTHCLPDFLIFGLVYDLNISEWIGYDIYKIIYNNLKQIFYMDKIFNNFNFIYNFKKTNTNTEFDNTKDILIFDIDLINHLINEIIYNKNKKEYKIKMEKLLYGYTYEGYENNFPLMNILSLFYSLCLYLFYGSINENKKINLINLLNDIQNYIIYLILASLIITENDHYYPRSYDQIQSLIYKNLFFCIKNIINHLNDKENKPKYIKILHNIIIFLSVINNINEKEIKKIKEKNFFSGIFSSKIDIRRTAPVLLINFLTQNMDELFNNNNFKIFTDNKSDREKVEELISEKIKKDIVANPSFDLYKISLFEKIITKRDKDLKHKLRLLIIEEKEFNIAINNYKKLYLKVKSFKNTFNFDETQKNRDNIFKIKKYRKIKEDLYSFNNSYSNLQIFYNLNEKDNKYLLKYKLSNFLSKDMTRKLLKPIIDINYYMPNFRKYKYESNTIYYHPNDRVYSVDLEIFNSEGNPPLSPDVNKEYDKNNYYIEENVCYIKTMNHIKGKIFHLNNLDNMCFYFCMTKLPSVEILIKNYEDYDSMNKSCFSSLFRNNMNKKDFNIYLKIKFSEILFIFNRKYCFRDNSLEIYTSNHKSYYFKFKNKEKRNKFLDHLITILNKDSSFFRKLYKPINSIDENNKKVILGYYKNLDNNNEYSTISNIKELWKNNKISTLEYLMWINIYGNRSYRDISQFPVLPWIIDNYKTKTFQEILENDHIRDFKTPMGVMVLDEKGKERAEGYIQNYKFLSLELKEEQIVDFKLKDDEEEEEKEDINKNNENNNIRKKSNTVAYKPANNNIEEESSQILDSSTNNSIMINQNEKNIKKNKIYQKIPKYGYNIDKLYTDLNIQYEKIPYCFGSHYSNGMYVSHFLGRLFPYALTMIEIQGNGFDCSERLFLCLDKTFLSSTNEKSDVRELIPEFYTIPEMFVNLNKLNFGEVNLDNFIGCIDYINEIVAVKKDNRIDVEDVLMPNWCKFNPYLFIIKKRELLESKYKIDLNPWIDFMFGCTQRGIKAQEIGNLYLPYVYDGVINCRIKDENVLKDRENSEYLLRLFELGVNATKVFTGKNLEKKKIIKQISDINQIDKPIQSIGQFEERIRFIANIGNDFTNLLIYYKKHKIKKITLEEKLDTNGNYLIKNFINCKDLNIIFSQDIASKLIIKYLYKSNTILSTGFYNGNLYLFNLDNNEKFILDNYNIINKVSQEDQNLLKNFGKGIITSLDISKDEKYIIFGNDKGILVIIENDYNIYLENNANKKYLKVLKIIPSHNGHIINSISINTDLNLFADYSYDNYVHIYTLPKCDIINSIFIKNNNINMDYIFLSAQPLASIILYSNKSVEFKCYNINGHDLNVEQNDKQLLDELKNKNCKERMISPLIFTDSQYVDYLLYVFGNQFILLRKMPLMDIIFKINFDGNELISFVNVSLNKEYIYAVDNNGKRVYLIKYKKNNKQISPTIPLAK